MAEGGSIASSFRELGYFAPLVAVPPEALGDSVAFYEGFQAKCRALLGGPQRFKAHLVSPWIASLVTNVRILDAVETVLGPDLLLWSSDFFVKDVGSGGFVSFHQDSTHAGLEPVEDIVNVWLALTPSTEESGCLQVVPRSHKLGQLAHESQPADENMLFYGQTTQVTADPVSLPLQAGQASFHSMRIVHGSGPNNASWPRIGLVMRFIAPWVQQSKARDSATLVRGRDTYGFYDLEPLAAEDFSAAGIAAFKDAIHRPSALG